MQEDSKWLNDFYQEVTFTFENPTRVIGINMIA